MGNFVRQRPFDANPKDAETSRHCAESLARMGQFDQAIACWHRVEQLQGESAETKKMISHLADERMRYAHGKPPVVETSSSTGGDTARSAEHLPSDQHPPDRIDTPPADIKPVEELAELPIPTTAPASAKRRAQREPRATEDSPTTTRSFRWPGIESLLALALAALYFQLQPSHWEVCVQALRNNLRIIAFTANVAVLLLLIWMNRRNLQHF